MTLASTNGVMLIGLSVGITVRLDRRGVLRVQLAALFVLEEPHETQHRVRVRFLNFDQALSCSSEIPTEGLRTLA